MRKPQANIATIGWNSYEIPPLPQLGVKQISWHCPGAENCHQTELGSISTTSALCQAGMMAFDHNRRMHELVLGSTTYGNL